MKAKVLTVEQKNSIEGKYFKEYHVFSPIEDANGNWILMLDSVQETTNPDYQWVKDLPEIDFERKQINFEEEIQKWSTQLK